MQSGASFRLIIRRGPQPNQVYELTRDTLTIGRDITNDITINDPEVSRHHSRMIRTGTGYTIEDLRSTNGTFVNRQRIVGPYALSNGDLIGMGETVTLAYEAIGVPASAATVIGAGAAPAAAPRPAPQAYAPVVAPVAEEVERREGGSRTVVIGVIIVGVLLCCAVIVGGLAFDQLNMYCSPPFDQFFACP